jgi:hypothetical protein
LESRIGIGIARSIIGISIEDGKKIAIEIEYGD